MSLNNIFNAAVDLGRANALGPQYAPAMNHAQSYNTASTHSVTASNETARKMAQVAFDSFLNRTEGYILTKEELAEKAWDTAIAFVVEGQKRGYL